MHQLVASSGHPRANCNVNRNDGAPNANKDANCEQAMAQQGIHMVNDEDAGTVNKERIYETR